MAHHYEDGLITMTYLLDVVVDDARELLLPELEPRQVDVVLHVLAGALEGTHAQRQPAHHPPHLLPARRGREDQQLVHRLEVREGRKEGQQGMEAGEGEWMEWGWRTSETLRTSSLRSPSSRMRRGSTWITPSSVFSIAKIPSVNTDTLAGREGRKSRGVRKWDRSRRLGWEKGRRGREGGAPES